MPQRAEQKGVAEWYQGVASLSECWRLLGRLLMLLAIAFVAGALATLFDVLSYGRRAAGSDFRGGAARALRL